VNKPYESAGFPIRATDTIADTGGLLVERKCSLQIGLLDVESFPAYQYILLMRIPDTGTVFEDNNIIIHRFKITYEMNDERKLHFTITGNFLLSRHQSCRHLQFRMG